MTFTQKRAHQRISVDINVNFYCDNTSCSGTVLNLSENGMFISTKDMCFPFDSEFEISVLLRGEILHIPVKVSRITKTHDRYDGIGVELLNPSGNYLEFIRHLRSNPQNMS